MRTLAQVSGLSSELALLWVLHVLKTRAGTFLVVQWLGLRRQWAWV